MIVCDFTRVVTVRPLRLAFYQRAAPACLRNFTTAPELTGIDFACALFSGPG
jgi:hypothetical protein